MASLKIGILGCTGRMGKMLVGQTLKTEGYSLVGGTVRQGKIEEDIGLLCGVGQYLGILATSDAVALAAQSDILIDFTTPSATLHHLLIAQKAKTPLVIGTTGFTPQQIQHIEEASKHLPIVFSPNMSMGIAALMPVVYYLAQVLDASYDIEIFDMHHRDKLDAPSGTALAFGKAAARGRGSPLQPEDYQVRSSKRLKDEVGFAVSRAGGVCGDTKVFFCDEHELIEISHRALNREAFARGALKAALWLFQAPAGLYTMQDVLGIKKDLQK